MPGFKSAKVSHEKPGALDKQFGPGRVFADRNAPRVDLASLAAA
jgi:hypothetical protein